MATSKRIEQIRKARDRRAKLIALVGVIVLAGLLAFEGPKTLKKLNSSKAPPAAPVASASQPGGSGGTAASTAAQSSSQPSAARLADTRIASVPAAGQLASFGQFKFKDPFVAQAGTDSPVTTGAAAAAAAQPSGQPQPVKPRPTGGSVIVQMGNGKGSSPGADAGIAPGVVLSMNGVAVRVAVGMTFPSGDPTFRLVSFKAGRARIGLTTGTFANGKKTILLVRGRTLTLLNTTAGTKYKLRLVSWSKAA